MTTVAAAGFAALTDHQAEVARAYLAERAAERDHLVIYLSGAHAYGFPSPDSDLDLKCVHVAPTRALVGLRTDPGGAERMIVQDGVELDYGSNELGDVLRGVVAGNGNYLERLLGTQVLGGDLEALATLRPLVTAVLSRRVARHYRGFAAAQLRAADERPTAKKLLYVLRTALTGRHLLATGELETDLTVLAPRYQLAVAPLVAIKQTGERVGLTADEQAAWRAVAVEALAALAAAPDTSPLPAEPPDAAVEALDAWLVAERRARF